MDDQTEPASPARWAVFTVAVALTAAVFLAALGKPAWPGEDDNHHPGPGTSRPAGWTPVPVCTYPAGG